MSMAITHFMAGITGGAIILILLAVFMHRSYAMSDLIILFISGIWAMIPDLNKFFSFFPKHAFWMNIFWFHPTLDALDPKDGLFFQMFFVVFGGFTILIYSWILKLMK
jgi:hypothetical protein